MLAAMCESCEMRYGGMCQEDNRERWHMSIDSILAGCTTWRRIGRHREHKVDSFKA